MRRYDYFVDDMLLGDADISQSTPMKITISSRPSSSTPQKPLQVLFYMYYVLCLYKLRVYIACLSTIQTKLVETDQGVCKILALYFITRQSLGVL